MSPSFLSKQEKRQKVISGIVRVIINKWNHICNLELDRLNFSDEKLDPPIGWQVRVGGIV